MNDESSLNNKIQYWIELADDDFDLARLLISNKKFVYGGYFCQATVEKMLKAFFHTKHTDNEYPPKTHNLWKLVEVDFLMDEISDDQAELLNDLNPLNLEARYPEDKKSLSEAMTQERTLDIFSRTEVFVGWLKTKLFQMQTNTQDE